MAEPSPPVPNGDALAGATDDAVPIGQGARWASLVRAVLANRLATDAAWVIGSYGYFQFLRLLLNVVLARLLAPAIFGVMTLVTTLRSGVELLTDIGVGQNIVVAKSGEEASFISTAWTIQAVRGAALSLVGLAFAWPLGAWYGRPGIAPLLALMSVLFLIGGLTAPTRALMQRRRLMRRSAIYEVVIATAGALANVVFAFFMPTVWGLAWATIVGALITLVGSFLILPLPQLRLRIDPVHIRTIMSFGKWIFVSSLVYFAATNFDRLYLPTRMTFETFGVYGIARTIADAATQLVQRVSTMVIFPAVARLGTDFAGAIERVRAMRRRGLMLASVGLGALIATADLFIAVAYDARYAAAGLLAPLLLLGAWFSIQAATIEAVLLGLSRPAHTAGGNVVKLGWILLLLPGALRWAGLIAGLAVIATADAPRYLWLAVHQRRAGLSFLRQDAAALIALIGTMLLVRLALVGTGVLPALVTPVQQAAFWAMR